MAYRLYFISLVALAAVLLLALAAQARLRAAADETTRVSLTAAGGEADGASSFPAISADSRYVVFESQAGNLVADDTNPDADIFLRDLDLGTVQLLSLGSDGEQANAAAVAAAISADGRHVAFTSAADNLVPDDTNDAFDVFIRDLQAETTERMSVSASGEEADAYAGSPTLSADGRYVAFLSAASNLVPDDTNQKFDVFVRDRQAGTTERVSVNSDGEQGDGNADVPAISDDGRFVAFMSSASNLVPGDTNGQPDVFVHDRKTWSTERVSVASDGAQASGGSYEADISADGRLVVFVSAAANLVPGDDNGKLDIFIHDLQSGQTERVSISSDGVQADGDCSEPAVSADGRFVAFASLATELVTADSNEESDVFVRDRQTGRTQRLSVDSAGNEGDGGSYAPMMAANGQAVALMSSATNLVMDDGNATEDIFLRRWQPATAHTVFLPVILNR